MIKFSEMQGHEALFTHVLPNGRNVHIASGRLVAWVQAHKAELEVAAVPITRASAEGFLRDNIVNDEHCMDLLFQILASGKIEPLLFCKDGQETGGRPDVLFVDGHHRYCVLALPMGLSVAPAYVLEPEQWKDFQVEDDLGFLETTKERLEAMPAGPLEYQLRALRGDCE